MAPSPPSILWRAAWSSALGKGGTDKAYPPHQPRSWQRHQGAAFVLAPKSSTSFQRAGDLILSAVRMEDPGARLTYYREHGPAGIPPCSPGEGVTPEGRLVLSCGALLSNLSGVLGADGLTHLLYLTPCLVHLLGGPQCRTHFGSISGTPCSTAATVAPGHGSGGSCFSCCRGYGQRVGQSGYPAPCFGPSIVVMVLELFRSGE